MELTRESSRAWMCVTGSWCSAPRPSQELGNAGGAQEIEYVNDDKLKSATMP